MFTSANKYNIFSIVIALTIVGVLCGFPAYSYAEENAVVAPTEVTATVDVPTQVPNQPAIVTTDIVVSSSATQNVSVSDPTPTNTADAVSTGTSVPEQPVITTSSDQASTSTSTVIISTDVTSASSTATSVDESLPAVDQTVASDTPPTLLVVSAVAQDATVVAVTNEVVSEETGADVLNNNTNISTEIVSGENTFDAVTGTSTLNEILSAEQTLGTPSTGTIPTETVSAENSFITTTSTTPAVEVVSGENSFTSTSGIPTTNEVVSSENTFVTNAPTTTVVEVVSAENDFTTLPGSTITSEVVSGENDFTTLPNGGCTGSCCTGSCPIDERVSAENDFTTLNNSTVNEVVSGENDFTTLPGGGGCTGTCCGGQCPINEQVSTENDFTTANGGGGCTSNCGGGGGGCTANCGGGGGGCVGSCGGSIILPPQCTLYLHTYMRQGYNNNPEEVRKLQLFLRVFEGFDIPVTGVYDQTTENAVRAFQSRYASDVLTPWGITENTGYAYITTTLKINYLYCGITDSITLDLRERFPGLQIGPAGLHQLEQIINTGTTTTLLPQPETGTLQNILQAAALGLLNLFDWLKNYICWLAWLLVLILLLIIAWLLYRLHQLTKELETLKAQLAQKLSGIAPAVGLVSLADLDDTSDHTATVDEEAVDKNWQEYAVGEEGSAVDPTITPLPLVSDSLDQKEDDGGSPLF